MVKNKRELLSLAAQWTTHAKNDLRNQLIAFMESVGTNQVRLADVLGLSDGEIDQILNGNGEITLSTFAKLLIATDNVLEIKPMNTVKRGGMPRGGMTPPRGGMMPPRGGMMPPRGGAIPRDAMPMGGLPMGGMTPPRGAMPMGGDNIPSGCHRDSAGRLRDSAGHFVSEPRQGGRKTTRKNNGGYPTPSQLNSMMQQGQCVELNLDELNRAQLMRLVAESGLSNAADFDEMSRSEIIAFLEASQQTENPQPTANTNRMEMVDNEQANIPMGDAMPTEDVAEDITAEVAENNGQDSRLAALLLDELNNNPQLRNVVQRYFNGN